MVSQISFDLADEITTTSAIAHTVADLPNGARYGELLFGAGTIERVGAIEVTVSLVSVGGMLNPIGTAPTVIDAYFDRLKLSAVDREGLREKLVAARNAHDADAAMVAVYRYLIPLMSAGEIAADFSVFNPTSGVDPHYASERVLTALPDLTLPDVQRITEERSHKVEPLTIHSAYFVSAIPRFVVVGEIRHGDGTRYVERVPIEISSAGSVIYLGR